MRYQNEQAEITELAREILADSMATKAPTYVNRSAWMNTHIQEQIDAGEWKFSEYRIPHLHKPCTYRREVYRSCPDGISWEYQGTFDSFGIVTADSMVGRVAKVLAVLDAKLLSL